ncbi:MAG: c-type cytochrome [Bdellovibrionales bacterium]|nr:c-type cytochrome [Bdellovibrionales bacterium]
MIKKLFSTFHFASLFGFVCWFGLICLSSTSCQSTRVIEPEEAKETKDAVGSPNFLLARGNYVQHCASCHGENRYGISGPALIPEGLNRLKKPEAITAILEGRRATQMPGFSRLLSQEQIKDLVDYIYSPATDEVRWSEASIKASTRSLVPASELKESPQFKADPWNLFFVVTHGDHMLSVLDGDRLEILGSFQMRPGLHGGIKYSSNGRYAYVASRDGWVTKIDVYNLKPVMEARVGINLRNIAISDDGKYLMAGNQLPNTLVLLRTSDFSIIKTWNVADRQATPSRVSAVYAAKPRQSFVIALRDASEVWEINYSEDPPAVHEGLVHDFRTDSGELEQKREMFPLRRIPVDRAIEDFFFNPDYSYLIGTSRDGGKAQILNLIVGRTIKTIDIEGMPHLGSGIAWARNKTIVMAAPNLKAGEISIIDTKTWQVLKKIQTGGAGFFLRSHEKTKYAWADAFLSEKRDEIYLINKNNLKVEKILKPIPGKTAAHVEFTKDGRTALVSIWDDEGYLIAFDSKTLKEIKRIPMKKPSGKYNVFNKTHLSLGTSH